MKHMKHLKHISCKNFIKRTVSLAAAALTLTAFSAAVHADLSLSGELPDYGDGEFDKSLPRVVDLAGLLTQDEEAALSENTERILDDWEFDCVILTVEDYREYGSGSIQAFADDFFDYGGYGVGSEYDGIIFVVSMKDRSWHFSTCGYGMEAINDYGLECLEDYVIDDLSDGDYYECFERFTDEVYAFVEEAKTNKPYSPTHKRITKGEVLVNIVIAGVVGALVAVFVTKAMDSKMKTVMRKPAARGYLTFYNETYSSDTFLYSNVRKIPKSNGGSGGGGSHRSSSGRSHGGRGGHF